MTNNNTKKSFIASLLALMLCVVMLIGTTFAWFTDTASTGVNTITAGRLGIELQQKNADGNWVEVGSTIGFVDANNAAIDRTILCEPGCSYLLPELRLVNTGNLALEYIVKITGTSGEGTNGEKLSDVIEVYVGNVYAGTLSEIIAEGDSIIKGKLLAENDEAYLNDEEGKGQIKLTMKTTAGNEYQGLSIDGIKIDVLASQTPHEYDSFNNQYDKDAAATISVEGVTDFKEAVNDVEDNGTILVTNAMTVTGTTDGDLTNTGKTTTIDFNGTTATGSNGNIAFRVRGNSVGNLQNGTIVADANTWSAISAAGNDTGKAVANISNMTLSNSKENGNCVRGFDNSEINIQNTTIKSSIGGCVEMANGILNIQSGIFTQTGKTTGEYDANSMNVAVHSGGTANIYGGTYTSETYGLYVFNSGGTMNVYGGTFKADKAVLIANEKAADAVADCVFNIYGGSFDGKIWMEAGAKLNIVEGTFKNTTLTLEQFKAYVAEGSTVEEVNGAYVVTK